MKKNVLIVTDSFPRWEGDSQSMNQLFDLASSLAKKFNVFVLTPHHYCCALFERLNDINIIRYKYFYPKWETICSDDGFIENMKKKKSAKFLLPCFIFSEFISIIKTIKKFDIDIIITRGLFPHGILVALIKKFIKIPHILSLTDTSFTLLSKIDFFGNYLIKHALKKTDNVVITCVYIRYILEKIAGTEFSPMIIPDCTDTEIFSISKEKKNYKKNLNISKNDKVFLFEGNLIEKSGIQYLLHAVKLLKNDNYEFKLLIIGTGNLEDELKNWCKTNSIENDVKFLGGLDKTSIAESYMISDTVIVPFIEDIFGDIDGIPISLINAYSAGIPVIATKFSGASDIIKDFYNGWLFEKENYYDLYSKMKLVFNSQYINSIKPNICAISTQYSIDVISDKYSNLIHDYVDLKK